MTSRATESPGLGARLSPLAAFLLAALTVVAMSMIYGGMHGFDAFYHTRAAAMYLSGEIPAAGENFHWTLHSVWNGAFSDKDFLFHVLLTPLVLLFGSTTGGLVLAGVAGAALMSGLLALTVHGVLRANGVRWPLFWVLVLTGISETFLFRGLMCRSYLLSVTFAVLGWQLALSGRRVALVAVSALYALTYTAPHLLLGIALIRGFAFLKWEGFTRFGIVHPAEDTGRMTAREAFAPALWVLVGLLIGWALHPHPLNLASLWLLQNLAVPLHSLGQHGMADWIASVAGFASDGTLKVDDIGAEMAQTTGRELLGRHLITCLMFVVPWMLATLVRVNLRRVDIFAWGTAGVFFVLMLAHERFTEYSAPFTVIAAALMFTRIGEALAERGWTDAHRRLLRWTLGAAVVAAAIQLPLRCIALNGTIHDSPMRPHALREGAGLVRTHLPEGSAVFHAAWDSFPHLFFYAPEYRYVTALDPAFLAAKSPDLYRRYREIGRGEPSEAWKGRAVHEVIRGEFGMEFALVNTEIQEGFAKLMGRAELAGKITLIASAKDEPWKLYWLKPLAETLGAGPKHRPVS